MALIPSSSPIITSPSNITYVSLLSCSQLVTTIMMEYVWVYVRTIFCQWSLYCADHCINSVLFLQSPSMCIYGYCCLCDTLAAGQACTWRMVCEEGRQRHREASGMNLHTRSFRSHPGSHAIINTKCSAGDSLS